MKPIILLLTLTAAGLAACDREPRLSDPAETVRAGVGENFAISLRDIPGTGYEWHLVDSASRAPLVLVDSAYWMSRANRRADGGAGIKSWTFVSHQKGIATVTLVHVPPSAPGTVGDTTRFRVIVE